MAASMRRRWDAATSAPDMRAGPSSSAASRSRPVGALTARYPRCTGGYTPAARAPAAGRQDRPMTDNDDGPFTLAFVGYTGPEPGAAERASAYEDAILPLLADHGAELVFRGRRSGGQDPELPVEFQLLRFPSRR